MTMTIVAIAHQSANSGKTYRKTDLSVEWTGRQEMTVIQGSSCASYLQRSDSKKTIYVHQLSIAWLEAVALCLIEAKSL